MNNLQKYQSEMVPMGMVGDGIKNVKPDEIIGLVTSILSLPLKGAIGVKFSAIRAFVTVGLGALGLQAATAHYLKSKKQAEYDLADTLARYSWDFDVIDAAFEWYDFQIAACDALYAAHTAFIKGEMTAALNPLNFLAPIVSLKSNAVGGTLTLATDIYNILDSFFSGMASPSSAPVEKNEQIMLVADSAYANNAQREQAEGFLSVNDTNYIIQEISAFKKDDGIDLVSEERSRQSLEMIQIVPTT